MSEDDVRGLFNHSWNQLLGRSRPGTLALRADDIGLHYEIDTSDTTIGRDTVTSINRSDIDGSSFRFIARNVTWEEITNEDGDTIYIRNINEVELYDVGPVTYPAYSGTAAGTRSRSWLLEPCSRREYRSGASAEADAIMSELNSWMGKRDARKFARQRRIRLAELGNKKRGPCL